MLYFVLSFGHARVGRHSRPLPCGRYSHAMLAKDESHALGQVSREQGVDIVIRRGVGYEEKTRAGPLNSKAGTIIFGILVTCR